jgi:hypothetical protein
MPLVIATLATNQAISDLRVFLQTLQLWNTGAEPTVYLFADKETVDALPSIPYKGRVVYKECLSGYTMLRRPQMERLPGRYGSLWAQFMAEKIALLEWAIETAKPQDGVFFFDSDITFFGPLPAVQPDATVALSPHLIRESDEARFGRYNGGFLWVKDAKPLAAWRAACSHSRFYEQAALECFDAPATFGPQHNYGWWRLWQGRTPAPELAAAWSMRRDPAHSGILVEGVPLGSVHTHWGPGQPPDAEAFNTFVKEWLAKLAPSHGPAKKLLAILSAAKK